jgi:ArsR family transcriptional regulator
VVESSVVDVTAADPIPAPGAPPLGTEDRAALLAVVADANRLALLQVLADGTACVCKLQERVPVAANLLSYHLKVLREAGLVHGTRRGRWIDYALTDGALDRLHGALPAVRRQHGR